MCESVETVHSLEDLRKFVHTTLCNRENLLSDQFAVTEICLRRGGRVCGMEFAIHGPRHIRLGAIWAADQNVLYFYNASGERFLKVVLPNRSIESVAFDV